MRTLLHLIAVVAVLSAGIWLLSTVPVVAPAHATER